MVGQSQSLVRDVLVPQFGQRSRGIREDSPLRWEQWLLPIATLGGLCTSLLHEEIHTLKGRQRKAHCL